MKVITEATLRAEFRNKLPDKYYVDPKVLITPSARQYLKEKSVELMIGQKEIEENEVMCKKDDKQIIPKYKAYASDAIFEKKPEYMTQIHGNDLVYKDHLRIILRGKLDSFQAKILELQVLLYSKGEKKLLEELEEVLEHSRQILRAEVLNKELNSKQVIGLNADQLREMSHHPQKYFGIGHIMPDYKMGAIIIALNSLRSAVREVEVAAVKAFRKEDGVERLDIIIALNRLSSCIYIMMCKYAAGLYR